MDKVALGIDLYAMAFAFGATAWFLFVQAPLLLAKLGREAFVPIQMFLTRILGRALLASTSVMTLAAGVATRSVASVAVLTAGLALLGALVNALVVIPNALRAGGRGHREIRGRDAEASTTGFASEGVGGSTALWHRLVVLSVVVMLAGLVSHGLGLVGIIGT